MMVWREIAAGHVHAAARAGVAAARAEQGGALAVDDSPMPFTAAMISAVSVLIMRAEMATTALASLRLDLAQPEVAGNDVGRAAAHAGALIVAPELGDAAR